MRKEGTPARVCKREGCAEKRGAVSEKRNKTNQKKKIEKGSSVERGVWNGASRTRRKTTLHHAPGPGEEGGVVPERGEGGVESQRKAEGEGHGV